MGLLAMTITEVLKRLDKRCVIQVKPPQPFSKDCVEVSRKFGILLEPIGEIRQCAHDRAHRVGLV